MSDHPTPLTVDASGPVEMTDTTTLPEPDVACAEITTTKTATVDAVLELDSDRLQNGEFTSVQRDGVVVIESAIPEVVADAHPRPNVSATDPDAWDITISGSLEAWETVAVRAADDSRIGNASVKRCAIGILTDLAEFAETKRPLLAALDIDDHAEAVDARDTLLAALREHDAADAEAEADTDTAEAHG